MAVRHRGRDDADVVRITSAPESPRTELGQRERRYLISMTVRTVCFIGAVVVGDNWVRWVLVAAAFLLPYVAVVMANSASPRVEGTGLPDPGPMHPQLGPGPSYQAHDDHPEPPPSAR
jgi:hypothetical protein